MRYLRVAGPILVLAVVAMSPVWMLALRATAPADLAQASSADRTAGLMVALAIAAQLALAGAATAAVSARSQVDAVLGGVAGIARAVAPVALALVAIVLGSLALAVPGLLLFALFAMAGPAAQTAGSPATVLASAAAAARRNPLPIAAVALALLAVDVGAVVAAHWLFASGLPAKPKPPDLARVVTYVHVVGAVLVIPAPAFAVALSALYSRATSAARSDAASSTTGTRASA